jgi:F0F1-type ATP synthase membrane subunit b/b'
MAGLLQFLGTILLFVIAASIVVFVVLFAVGMNIEYRRRNVARAVDEVARRDELDEHHVSLDEYRSRRHHPTGDATDTYLNGKGGTDR